MELSSVDGHPRRKKGGMNNAQRNEEKSPGPRDEGGQGNTRRDGSVGVTHLGGLALLSSGRGKDVGAQVGAGNRTAGEILNGLPALRWRLGTALLPLRNESLGGRRASPAQEVSELGLGQPMLGAVLGEIHGAKY